MAKTGGRSLVDSERRDSNTETRLQDAQVAL